MDNTFTRDNVLENIPSDKSTDLLRSFNGEEKKKRFFLFFQLITTLCSIKYD